MAVTVIWLTFTPCPGQRWGRGCLTCPGVLGASADTKDRSRRLQLLLLPGAGKRERREGREGWLRSAVRTSRGDVSKRAKKILKPLQ